MKAWSIAQGRLLFYGTYRTKDEAIRHHCFATAPIPDPEAEVYFQYPYSAPKDVVKRYWKKCQEQGKRAVKVEVKIVN